MPQDPPQILPSTALGPLLFLCARLLDETAQAQVNREAGARVARPALMRLLPFLNFEGIRPTELARRVDISKQAVGQSLAELEARGLVEYTVDPQDGRARLVRLTAQGAAAFEHGHSVLAFLEAELAQQVGEEALADTVAGLVRIAKVLEHWQIAGAPTRRVPQQRLPSARQISSKTPGNRGRSRQNS